MSPVDAFIEAGITPRGPIFADDDVTDAIPPGPAADARLRQELEDAFPVWCALPGLRGAIETMIAVSNAAEQPRIVIDHAADR